MRGFGVALASVLGRRGALCGHDVAACLRTGRLRACIALVSGVIVVAHVSAQPFVTYDAAMGTLPDAQCWSHLEDINPVMAYPLSAGGGDLHLSTLGFGVNVPVDNGGGVWFQRSDVAINFNQDFIVEASVRIVSAPDHSINPVSGWPRPGYALTVYDVQGRLFWVGLGSGEVFLSNTAFGMYGTANTATMQFNTTDAHHVYRISRAAGGIGATLSIDGVPRLTLPATGPVENSGGLVYFGDPTYWANSESLTAWVRYSGAGPSTCCDSIDFNRDGLFPDTADIDDFLSVFSGGPCTTDPDPGCGDIDFNNDGLFPDTADIDALLSVFSGGACF